MDGGGGDEEAALSDFEEDDLEAEPVLLPAAPPAAAAAQNSIADGLKVALSDLDDERQARKVAEAAKADADAAALRLKSVIHELIRQRDEALRHKDEVARTKEERSKQLEDALQVKEDVTKQRDDVQRQRDDISRARDSARAEIEGVALILVTQAEKITSMSSKIKSFPGGLPRVPKSTGLAAIALGFSKRVEEVVEEVLRQWEDAVRQRNELHMQMEQRNFSIAIEVSQLEASITQLKDQLGEKSADLEKLQKLASGKDGQIADIERATVEQLDASKQEAERSKRRAEEVESKLVTSNSVNSAMARRVEEVESKLRAMTSAAAQNIECAAEARVRLSKILGLMHPENALVPSQREPEASPEDEEDLQESFLAAGREMLDLSGRILVLWAEKQQKAEGEREDFENTVKILHAEKGNILQKLSFSDNQTASPPDSETGSTGHRKHVRGIELQASTRDENSDDGVTLRHEINTDVAVLENSTKTYQIIGDGPQQASLKLLQSELAAHEKRKEQAAMKISLLEQDIENLQQELKRTGNLARVETDKLQQRLVTNGRDLTGKTSRILELEKAVEALTGELLAAEEEVVRWKEAATAEAAAGAGILEEVEARNKEVSALNERVAKFRELMEEANTKVGSKEDMAMAAIAALNAAERSRQIADERAADLRDRIEEMNRQLEELEQRREYRGCGLLEKCWPWLRGYRRPGQEAQLLAEMEELLEPLV